MKSIEVSNKVHLIRHWFVWYRVQRGGAQWDKLKPIIKSGRLPRTATIESAAASLKKAKPVAQDINPPIDLTE